LLALGVGGIAFAQDRSDIKSVEGRLITTCKGWRVSESFLDLRGRKPLGKSTEDLCRDVAKKWSGRFVEWYRANDVTGPLNATVQICREVAEKVAGRPVEIVWCSSWNQLRGGELVAVPGPPEEVWNALDGSPFEGISIKKSSRDESLRSHLEHRLGKDWDQVRLRKEMEAIGFVCGVMNRRREHDPLITSSTPKFVCTGGVGEIVGAPSRPLLVFGLYINVSLKFAESGEPQGWQQIEVRTFEKHL
jgi:hypothetical protein